MKVDFHLTAYNLVGFAVAGVAYLLAHSGCLGLPGWVSPVLLTIQAGLNAVAPSLLAKA